MRSMTSFVALVLIVLSAAAIPAGAEETAAARLKVLNVRTYTLLGFLPAPTGGDVAVSYGLFPLLAGRSAEARFEIGGGYERDAVYRFADGSPYVGEHGQGQVDFDTAGGYAMVGAEQLVAPRLEVFSYVTTVLRWNFDNGAALFDSEVSGRYGTWTNAVLAGISYDAVVRGIGHGYIDGFGAETSVEWGPRFLANDLFGVSDYVRVNFSGRFYLPVFDLQPDRRTNLLSLYLAEYFSFDWADGSAIPIHIQQSFGGRTVRPGLGRSVRGFEKKSYDAAVKAVNNIEARLVGPALGVPNILPIVVAFLDAGFYSGFVGDPSESGPGALLSAGTTVGVNVLDIAYLGATFGFPLSGSRIDGKPFGFDVVFALHF